MIGHRGALLIAFVALVGAWEAFGALRSGCEARKGCAKADVVLCGDDGSHHYERPFAERAAEFFHRRSARRALTSVPDFVPAR